MSIAEERIAAALAAGAQRLSLRRLQLEELPASLARLQSLRALDLSGNRLTQLSAALFELRELRSLDVSGNALAELPEGLAELAQLRELDASGNPLQSLPAALGRLGELRELALAGTALRAAPEALWRLPALQVLSLAGNALESLPDSIRQLGELRELDLGGNALGELPDALGALAQMRVLGLAANRLQRLPAALAGLGELRALALEHNALPALPEAVCGLARLERLWLAGNRIEELPGALATLGQLQELDLRDNQLREIPALLAALPRLAQLELAGNPLAAQLRLVAELGSAALLSLVRGPRASRCAAEVLLLGRPGAGKTSLARALRGQRSWGAARAEGPQISRCALPLPAPGAGAGARADWLAPLRELASRALHQSEEAGELALRIWDGADPELCDRLQPPSLAERAFCIAVFDAGRAAPQDDLEPELEALRQRAAHARCALAARVPAGASRTPVPVDLDPRFDALLVSPTALAVDCRSPESAAELRRRVAVELRALDGDAAWSERYVRAEQELIERGRRDPYISRAELGLLLERAGFEEGERRSAAAVLRELGALVHFPESELLADFAVLDAQWLAQALGCALELAGLPGARGELRLGALRAVWSERYPDLFPQLYACLRQLELCYPLAGRADCAVVPLRLPAARPELPWAQIPGAQERCIAYECAGGVPAGLMSRFIAKAHALLGRSAELPAGVCWRDGAFFERGEAEEHEQGLCELERGARRLWIRVRAAYPQNLLEQLDGWLRATLAHYPGLELERSYGCSGRHEQPCPNLYTEERVLYHLQLAKPLLCEKTRHAVEPFALVCGLGSFASAPALRPQLEAEIERRPEWAGGLGGDPRSALLRSAQLEATLLELIRKREEMPPALRQLLHQNRRELLALLDTREPRATPALFTVHPLARGRFAALDWERERYCLRLYCEAEDHLHPSGYALELGLDRGAWLRVQPVLSIGLRALALSLAPALTAGALLQPAEFEQQRAEVSFAQELQRLLPVGLAGAPAELRERERIAPERVSSSARDREALARQLAQFCTWLASLDAASARAEQWGDLLRCELPGGARRWLCPQHRPLL